MPRVLIVSDLFPPGFGPRPGALSKYLPGLHWEVAVVAFESSGTFVLPGATSSGNVTWVKRVSVPEEIDSLKKWPRCLHLMNPLRIEMIREGLTLSNLLNALHKEIEIFHPDILLATTSGSVALFRAVAKAAKEFKIPWVGDIRDLLIQTPVEPGSTLQHWAATRRLLQFLPDTAAITTISVWHKEYIEAKTNRKVEIIYNGYDPDLFDNKMFHHQYQKFRITFAGTFMTSKEYGGGILFQACAMLVKKGVVQRKDLDIAIFSSTEPGIIYDFAAKHDLVNETSINGYVPHTAIPKILAESTLLVVLTSNHRRGIMGTKVYEYLASRKPILCIPEDDGSITNLLKDTNAGFSVSTIEETAGLIKSFYYKWQEREPIESGITDNQLRLFSRKDQAKQFSVILNRSIGQ